MDFSTTKNEVFFSESVDQEILILLSRPKTEKSDKIIGKTPGVEFWSKYPGPEIVPLPASLAFPQTSLLPIWISEPELLFEATIEAPDPSESLVAAGNLS